MTTRQDEEQHLHAAALQNAQSILVARLCAEEELRKQSEWLRVTLGSIGDAVVTTDADDRVNFMNVVAESLVGRTQHDVLGHPLREVLHLVREGTGERVNRSLFAADHGAAISKYDGHLALMAADGSVRPVEVSTSAIQAAMGDARGSVFVIRDITDRRRAQARDRFLIRLDDVIRPLVDPREITLVAAKILGEYLEVDRCAYADVESDENTFNLMGNHTRHDGIKSIVGRLRFVDFGSQVLRLMREGKPFHRR